MWSLIPYRAVACVAIVVAALLASYAKGRMDANSAADKRLLHAYEVAQKVNRETTEKYREELTAIRSRPAAPRVFCKADLPQPSGGVTGPSPSDLPGEAGKDVGRPLFALADDADRCAVQLNALIEVVTGKHK